MANVFRKILKSTCTDIVFKNKKNMKITCLLFHFIFISFFAFSKNMSSINGYYLNSSQSVAIIIKGDSLFMHSRGGPGIPDKVLAVCSLQKINTEFYEIKSCYPPAEAFENISIEYNESKKSSGRQCRIYFNLPNYNDSLNFYIFTKEKGHEVCIGKDKNYIDVPFSEEFISFVVDNPLNLLPCNPDATFWGCLYYGYYDNIILKENMDMMTITLPNIKQEVFNLYYIQKDYIRIVNKKLFWRGGVFTKRDDFPLKEQ